MIEFKYKKTSKFLVMGISGTLMALCGFLIYYFDPLNVIIKAFAVLAPNSILFKIWSKPPYEINVNVYIFNITNSKEFLENGDKLQLEQIGPYVYQEIITNTDGHFNDNGTITFAPKRHLVFKRELSVGDTKEDRIIAANIPLLGISSSLKDKSFFVNFVVANIATALDSQIFLELTIDEYLWGYDDKLVDLANKALPNWINFPRFGIMDRMMALDNASNVVTIKTKSDVQMRNSYQSESEREMLYTISEFNGSPGLHHWGFKDDDWESNSKCNTVEGVFVEGLFTPDMDLNNTLRLYRRAFCRPVDFRFEKKEVFKGYDANVFRVDPLFLARPEENPDNACYCYKGKCPKKGLSYLTPCYYDIPVAISQPHYLNSDPSLSEQVIGMEPNVELHDSTLKVHSQLGVPLEAKLRIQINLEIDTRLNNRCKPMNGLTLPLFWLELDIVDLPTQVDWILYMLYNILPISQIVLMWLFILFGPALVAAAALISFYTPHNHGLEDPYANRIGYSPIRIIPMTAYLNENLRISK
ncbi:PREDICTED: scavenger receptor class B member 1 [Nicrophorus vespilloides]|uniref:Scavenger receptor class B member 1 n=1 Tax=Nicrophorus vespilloides TaxID=110193 RepID=A0ABM1M436_NICVS|nr:PREDICTED: scavenger receptor class B member 1 [Nicrophorus vespilloides]